MEEVQQTEASVAVPAVEEEEKDVVGDVPVDEKEERDVKTPISIPGTPPSTEQIDNDVKDVDADKTSEDAKPSEWEDTEDFMSKELSTEAKEEESEKKDADDEEAEESLEPKAGGSGTDLNETVFEEVDADVSAEKSAVADESDMLGQADMTVPAEEHDEADEAPEKVLPMEVDNSSSDDVEMISIEDATNSSSKPDDTKSAEEKAAAEPSKPEAEVEDVQAMETETQAPSSATENKTAAEGEDVVDEGSSAVDDDQADKSTKTTAELSTAEEDHGEDIEQPPDKEGNEEEDNSDDEEDDDVAIVSSESGKKGDGKEAEKKSAAIDDEVITNDVNEDADMSASRKDDDDPDVENVQEPEESDVCLIPDTETEMTDADKERAIQAREIAEKESELLEDDAAEGEKESSDPASEEAAQEPLLEEMVQQEPTSEGTPHKVIIFLAVSARRKCIQCDKQKVCGFRFKDADKTTTDYVCDMACVDNLLAANPGKFFLRRKKFLVDEVPDDDESDHKCLQCKKNKSNCKYFFKQDEEMFYVCSEDCYKTLSTDEPEKFNLKRDSIRVRNIGHTTISSKGASNTETRIVSRSAAEAEAARVERAKSFIRRCMECVAEVRVNSKLHLIWQTMDFCDELCLGKYQRRVGAQCQTCRGDVPHQSLGKYCVRFGFVIRQFCCASCLNNFKKGLKTCCCCQRDISASGEGFLAPVGDKEQFKDFCSQACMRRYDSMCNPKKKLRTDRCAVCNFEKPMRVEMTIDGKEQNFCSNPCFSAFKFVSNIVPDQCGMCSKYFERKSAESYTIYGEKHRPKVFCSRICFNVYIIVNRQITSCQWCKVKKYDFDMITKIIDQRQVMMCSLNCLTLYGVSINAFSRTAIKCDNCNACTTPQYHLTMSDASMRNFCTYQCVMQFQSQFARVPLTLDSDSVSTATHHISPKQQGSKNSSVAPFPTGLPKRVKLSANQMKNAASSASPASANQNNQPVVPVISNVASLATGQNETLIGNTTVRRSGPRSRTRGGKKYVNESQPPRIPTPPPAAAPTTRTRSSTSSPILSPTAGPTTSSKAQIRGGRTATRSSASTSETNRSSTPIDRHVESKIVTVPPYPPMVRNVQTSCRPKTDDVSIDCKPETSEIGIQTDEDYSAKVLIPVPVPIYVPQPMYMYSAPFPVPVPIPLPIPVPIFIPTTRNSANGILKEIKKIQDKMPADPFEAELLMMAEMVADDKNESDSNSEEETKPEPRIIPVQYPPQPAATNNVIVNMEQTNASFSEDVLQMALKMASGEYEEPGVDLESAMTANTITHPPGMVQAAVVGEDPAMQMGHHNMMMDAHRGARGRKRGAVASPITPRNNHSPIKRQRLSAEHTPPQQPVVVEKPDANMCLKFTFGVNAWKQWVMTKNADIEKSSIRRRLFKTELLQMTADELNYSLCLFVKEVRKPNGTEYAPDTIYYLVLGIQQYLYENGRIDNIFTDPYYERFTDCLDEVARKFSVLYNDSQYIVTRVEEEHLWECKQLGAHSPHVLLSTLMFFNTKHFNLTTVEEHMQLSFSHIMKHWKRSAQNAKAPGTRNVLLRFYPPQAGLDANPRKKKVYEQQENEERPLRCPVRLYEFYLSKCPESVKTRNDVFYLQPERSCVPDSPVWYSTQALSQEALQKMLHRVKMVKEINIALLTS